MGGGQMWTHLSLIEGQGESSGGPAAGGLAADVGPGRSSWRWEHLTWAVETGLGGGDRQMTDIPRRGHSTSTGEGASVRCCCWRSRVAGIRQSDGGGGWGPHVLTRVELHPAPQEALKAFSKAEAITLVFVYSHSCGCTLGWRPGDHSRLHAAGMGKQGQ